MLLNLTAYFIIPLFTLLLTMQDDMIASNLSVLSIENREAFMIWAILIIFYFCFTLTKIIRYFELKLAVIHFMLLFASCFLLLVAVGIPYIPSESYLKAQFHVLSAFASTICLLTCLFLITGELAKRKPPIYMRFFLALIFIVMISAVLFFRIGIVSGLLELFITVSAAVLTRILLAFAMKKHKRPQKE